MKQITLTLNISPAAAVRASRSSCGEHQVVLGDADVAALTDDQRDTLARHLAGERCEGGVINWSAPLTEHAEPISDATPGVVAGLLTARRARIEMQRAESAAKVALEAESVRAARASVLAYAQSCPIQELDNDGDDKSLYHLHSTLRDGNWPELYNLPRESAAVLVGRQGELASYRDGVAEAKAARKAANAAEKAAASARIAAWIIEHAADLPENIVRASAEGRDTSSALNSWLVTRLEGVDAQIASMYGGYVAKTYDSRPHEWVPSNEAYALLDAIKAEMHCYTEATFGESIPDGEPKIVMADIARHGPAVWRAGVEVSLTSTIGLGEAHQIILAEPANDDSE